MEKTEIQAYRIKNQKQKNAFIIITIMIIAH